MPNKNSKNNSQLFLETIAKNKIEAKAITPIKIVKYKFTKTKERKSTPKIKPKQIA